MAEGTKYVKNRISSMQIFLLPMLLSVLRLTCIHKLYLYLPNILGLLMLECYLETKAFSPFLSLKLNQYSRNYLTQGDQLVVDNLYTVAKASISKYQNNPYKKTKPTVYKIMLKRNFLLLWSITLFSTRKVNLKRVLFVSISLC